MVTVTDPHRGADRLLRVLAIDDDAGDAELLRRGLAQLRDREIALVHASNLDAARRELARPEIDLVFLDYALGATTGQQVLQSIRASGDLRPIIVLTGHGDEHIAAAVLRSGADDYLVKSALDGPTLGRAIDNARAQHARRAGEEENRRLPEHLQAATAQLAQQNRRLAELYDTAHQFVDHVSHEFRTPLAVIKEFAALMRDGLVGETSAAQHNYLGVIVQRVDDLSILIDDMLDISKLEAGALGISRADCGVAEIVERVRTTLERRAAASHARLEFDLAADLPRVYCDPEKAGRVITNLVINALKFCGDHGEVLLRARGEPTRHEVVVAIIDNGPGIPPESVKLLFERFRQLAGHGRSGMKGFGLGLSIARELVHLNLGDISVESQPGVGSTFSFTIPIAERRALLARYLDRVEQFRSECSAVALVCVESDAGAAPALLDELAALVQHHTRRTDLLFRVRPHRWLLVAAANQPDLQPLIERLHRARDVAAANRPDGALPPLFIDPPRSWNFQTEREAFVAAFLAAERAPELAHERKAKSPRDR
ncbi:MAG: ATP-binding protein [Phycisphaerae bacterium]